MSYQTRKFLAGQEVVKKITLNLNQCKYTKNSYQTIRNISFKSPASYAPGYTGSVISDSASVGLFALWGYSTTVYAKLAAPLATEIFKISIDAFGNLALIERGVIGTIQQTLSGAMTFYHLGELDGSCTWYSQTCSTADSYESRLFKRVTFATAPLPSGSIYHGGLEFKSIRYDSAEVSPGESIGSRSRLSFSIIDQKHNDYDTVFYPSKRTEAGTMFGKLIARHPYFNGRIINYSIGLRDAGTLDEPEWETRTLLIDKVNLTGGKFTCTALDPLILTEGKKAKMPIASTAQLTSLITSGSTSIQFGNAAVGYFGSSGNVIVRIDSELIEVTANGTATMPIVTRGFGNSEIKDHSINATVQNCIRFIDEHVIDCITYALTTWTATQASYIGDYSATKALIPTAKISDYVLSSPIDVVEFINKCILIGNLIFYFDDVTSKIKISVTQEDEISQIYISETNHIKKDSVKKDLNLGEQFTRFNMSWAPYDKTKEGDATNYQISLTAANLGMESPNKIGEINEKKAVVMPLLNASTADYLLGAGVVNRVVSYADIIPEVFYCTLDAESIGDTQGGQLGLGTIVNVQSSENQNSAGIGDPELYQVVKISGEPFYGFDVKMRRYRLEDPEDFDFVIEPGVYTNYNLTSNFAPTTPGQYLIFIKAGAIFGSYDTAVSGFRTGTPAAGVTFKIIARWQVLGMGGVGGDAGSLSGSAQHGADGGLALEIECDCMIDNGAGLIWAGGGGGEGEIYVSPQGPFGSLSPRKGGCGGQGFGTSIGGFNTDGQYPTTRAQSGSQSGHGTSGIAGGEWGKPGVQSWAFPSAAGIAIKSNGFNVTIISGDNPLSIRGLRT